MKESLIKSAAELTQPGPEAAEEFSRKRDQLAALCTQVFENRADIQKLVGRDNIPMARDNNRNFSRFMESLFGDFQPEVLVETALWVFRAYRSHGFQTTYWPANLNIWVDALKQELSPDAYAAVYPFYNWLIVNIPIFVKLTDEMPDRPVDMDGHGH